MAVKGHGAIVAETFGWQVFEITRLKALLEERDNEITELKLQIEKLLSADNKDK